MDTIITSAISISIILIATGLLYIFRVRQLYLCVPKLFTYNELTTKGQTIEIKIFNKSRKTEENILVDFDPLISLEMIAATNSGATINKNALHINRLPALTEISVIFIAEGEKFTHESVSSISSKDTKGTIYTKENEIPPNWANLTFSFAAPLILIVGLIFGMNTYFDHQRDEIINEKQLKIKSLDHHKKDGWIKLDRYALSELRNSYSDTELPLTALSQEINKRIYNGRFKIINNTAAWLEYSASVINTSDIKSDKYIVGEYIFDIRVEPKGTKTSTIKKHLPKGVDLSDIYVQFVLSYGDEEYIYMHYQPSINEKSIK